jgi:hypothetical protein
MGVPLPPSQRQELLFPGVRYDDSTCYALLQHDKELVMSVRPYSSAGRSSDLRYDGK